LAATARIAISKMKTAGCFHSGFATTLRSNPPAGSHWRRDRAGYKNIRRERTAGAHVFSAILAPEDLIGSRLRAMAEKLCGGSLTPLLTHLVRAERLTAKQRQELRTLIDELDQKSRRSQR